MRVSRSATAAILVPALFAGLGLTGCTAMLLGDGQRDGTSAAETRDRRSTSDAELTAAVRSRLIADTSVEASDIDVATAGGRVTLSGLVASFAERDRAGQLAGRVPGVVAVVNRLTVNTGR